MAFVRHSLYVTSLPSFAHDEYIEPFIMSIIHSVCADLRCTYTDERAKRSGSSTMHRHKIQ